MIPTNFMHMAEQSNFYIMTSLRSRLQFSCLNEAYLQSYLPFSPIINTMLSIIEL